MAGGSKKVIYAALVGNGLIAVTKFAAASLTGSSAMLSEAIHSVVDTGNQGLLLYGLKRAEKPPDERHPFGYGPEIYFWTFVVAILIFAVGSGVSLYEGVIKVITPHPIHSVYINYIVLGLAMIFESFAWWIAFKEFRRVQGNLGFIEAVRQSKDPTVFTVLFEDTAAGLGLIIAFIGIFLGQMFDLPVLDGVASILIGVILAVTAAVLAYEAKGLLIGESANPDVIADIRDIVAKNTAILGVNEILTLHLGPRDILLTLSIDFADEINSVEVEQAISDLETDIKKAHPSINRVFIEAQSLQGHLNAEKARAAILEGAPEKPAS